MFGGQVLDFTPPWRRVSYGDLFQEHAGVSMADIDGVRAKASALGIEHAAKDDAVVINEVFEQTAERHLVQPTFVYDYPRCDLPVDQSVIPTTRRSPCGSRHLYPRWNWATRIQS